MPTLRVRRQNPIVADRVVNVAMDEVLPDLSHLTPEEKRVIESVLRRQKEEEAQERMIMERKREEMVALEEQIRERRKAGGEMESTCHICLKTKFADGFGHICHYCNIRCCARCGGKVTLRSNKVIWVCILCRKKQELLSKTGQWINQRMTSSDTGQRLLDTSEQHPTGGSVITVATTEKRDSKLERTQSASEKENIPFERSGCGGATLRRQLSHQEQQQQQQQIRFGESSLIPAATCVDNKPPSSQSTMQPIVSGISSSIISNSGSNVVRAKAMNDDTRLPPPSLRKELPPQPPHPHQMESSARHHIRKGEISSSGYTSDSYTTQSSFDRFQKPCQRTGSSTMIYSQQQQQQQQQQPPAPPVRRRRNSARSESGIRTQALMVKEQLLQQQRSSYSSSEEDLKSYSGTTGDERDPDKNKPDHQALGADESRNKQEILSQRIKKFLANPLSWKPSPDGKTIIGHMILKKSGWDEEGGPPSASMLGLKVVGGKLLDDGRRGAIIERVKTGSVADVEGHLRPGDEVLEWNGRSLREKSYQDVRDIIAESKQEPQVELIVSRTVQTPKAPLKQPYLQRRGSFEKRDKPSVTVTSPSSPDVNLLRTSRRSGRGASNSIGGRIQVKLWFDSSTLRLVVTLVCAMGLVPRSNGQPRNPYCKLYLLPDRSEKSKRRTKSLANTNEPRWNQSFVYSSVRRADLKLKMIEISVWDYVRYGTNDFLGEARIELAIVPLNDEPEWIHLGPHEEFVITRQADCGAYMPSDHLSPPLSSSRLSDSDTSDVDDTSRRVADGASISSLGSSASPPPDYEVSEKRRSRKDAISPQEQRRVPYFGSLHKHQSLERDSRIVTDPREYQRSRSVAPSDFPLIRSRSKSPQRMYDEPMHPIGGAGRAQSSIDIYASTPGGHGRHGMDTRSATSTPISSPKRRQLPRIPASVSPALRERISQDLEVRGFFIKNRSRIPQQAPTGGSHHSVGQGGGRYNTGWGRHHVGGGNFSSLGNGHQNRSLSPPSARAVFGDHKKEADGEDSYSIDSSTFSTQSDKPQGTRYEDEYDSDRRRGSAQQSSSTLVGPGEVTGRCYSHSDEPADKMTGGYSDTETPVHHTSRTSSRTGAGTVGKSSNESSSSDLTSSGGGGHRSGTDQSKRTSPSTSERGGTSKSTVVLPKKSNSTSQLSATDGSRTGGDASRRKHSSPGGVSATIIEHKSQDLASKSLTGSASSVSSSASPTTTNTTTTTTTTTISTTTTTNTNTTNTTSSLLKNPESDQLQDFIGSLGQGQLVGRQVLGSPSLGEVQLSLAVKKGRLEVEVIRARGLQSKPTYKNLPTPYVKLYLVKGKKCLEKHKAKSPRETLDPLYQTSLTFKENCEGCVLQVTIWGDYGRFDIKKVFMGVAQIALSDLNLNTMTIGWYKLFGTSSLKNVSK